MIDLGGLHRLLTWLSPAFPVGGFAWSAGLETAIAELGVASAESTRDWLVGSLQAGAIRSDAIILAHAWRAGRDAAALAELADLLLALAPAWERHAETLAMGRAFVQAASVWPSDVHPPLPDKCPYPVAVGAIAAAQAIPLEAALLAFVAAAVQAQVSVAVRVVPLGQTAGLSVLAGLETAIVAAAREAGTASLADIGGMAYAADIAQMRHETQQPRLFRS